MSRLFARLFAMTVMISVLIFVGIALIRRSREHFQDQDQDQNALHVKMTNGVGDRILDLISTFTIATFTGADIKIEWDVSQTYYLPRQYDLSLLNLTNLPSHKVVESIDNHININPSATLTPYYVYKMLGSQTSPSLEAVVSSFISTAAKIQISQELSQYIPSNIEDCVAIHLRRTDKIIDEDNGIVVSTSANDIIMARLFAWIERYIGANDTISFYVCTDDPDYKSGFIAKVKAMGQKLGKHVTIITTEKELLPTAFRDAHVGAYELLEMFCLRKCKTIVQSTRYSTFSMAAALMSQKPLINFSDHRPDWLLYAWRPCLHVTINGKEYDHVIKHTDLALLNRMYSGM